MMPAMSPDGDYEVTEVMNAAGQVLVTHRRCLHKAEHVEKVEVAGEVVAHLCIDCDAQLPEWWRP